MGPSSSGCSEWGHPGLQGISNVSLLCCVILASFHLMFLIVSLKNVWIRSPEFLYSVFRSISGSFSCGMRQSACELCSCRSSEWSWRILRATRPTWSVWQPSMLQGMGPAPCPPEGALSKQVGYSQSWCLWPCARVTKTSGIGLKIRQCSISQSKVLHNYAH